MVLWNRFLVLAVVFGIAEEVIAQLKVTVPEVVQDPGFAMTYWWVYGGGIRQLAGLVAAERLRVGVLGRRERDVVVIRRRWRFLRRRWRRRWRRWRWCRLAAAAAEQVASAL